MVARYVGDAQWIALDADAKPTNAAVADTLTTLDTRRQFIHQGAGTWIEIGSLDPKSFETRPSYRKTGGYYGVGSTTGTAGLIEGRLGGTVGTPGNAIDADGTATSWTTLNSAAPEQAGLRATSTFTRRDFNPHYRIKFKILTSLASTRLAAGFTHLSAILAGADPLANLYGVVLYLAAGGGTFNVRHNNGAATSTVLDTGVTATAGTAYVFECWGDADNSRWTWNMNNSAQGTLTSAIPSATQNLTIAQNIETTATLARTWYIYDIEVDSDK